MAAAPVFRGPGLEQRRLTLPRSASFPKGETDGDDDVKDDAHGPLPTACVL